jgi:hypothetical protein
MNLWRGRARGRGADMAELARERERLLNALENGPGGGPVLFRRMYGVSTAGRPASRPQQGDQAYLYPALHSLESSWRITASWLPGDDGVPHRSYRIGLRPR